MAINYKTQTGDLHFNLKAKSLKENALEPELRRMSCNKCGRDSTISFHQHNAYSGSGSIDWQLEACCFEFEQRIYKKLGVNRESIF